MEFINRDKTSLVVVDMQEKLIPAIPKGPRAKVIKNSQILIETANTLGMPIVATEQYPKGLGPTVEEISSSVGDGFSPIEKLSFSCARSDEFKSAIKNTGRPDVLICGIETHVCVLQTVIDLMNDGHTVYVPADAVASRRELDWSTGLKFAEKAGAVVGTTETFFFQLLERAGTDEFKKLVKLVK
ncbi:MAG: hydrolase [Candidatus Dadabacteria bacterium]|nr:hydrolase [Candidatus Dadabacteria bacterium]